MAQICAIENMLVQKKICWSKKLLLVQKKICWSKKLLLVQKTGPKNYCWSKKICWSKKSYDVEIKKDNYNGRIKLGHIILYHFAGPKTEISNKISFNFIPYYVSMVLFQKILLFQNCTKRLSVSMLMSH